MCSRSSSSVFNDSNPIVSFAKQQTAQSAGDLLSPVTPHSPVNSNVKTVFEFVAENNSNGQKGLIIAGNSDTMGSRDEMVVSEDTNTENVQQIGANGEERTFVNTEERTSVVVGAFLQGEEGDIEGGDVTLPFRDLVQLIGGEHYHCATCEHNFSVKPNSTYNMIHTGQTHILVINLGDDI